VKVFVIAAAAVALCFAATESRVSRANILSFERTIQERLSASSADPYDLLGDARGTYLEGYGVLFTTELDLINAGVFNATPFKPKVSPQEIAMTRERKLKKLEVLKDSMRGLMMDGSGLLDGLAPTEHIAMEAILFNYKWENTQGIPHRVFMMAEKQKLQEARAAHASQAELAKIIEEQDR
jgi:hypothetical protein